MGGYYIDSKFKQGFPRWERARINALIEPESAAAKLYRGRVEKANVAVAGFAPDRPLTFYSVGSYHRGKVNFRVCSAFCAAMELQLQNGPRSSITAAALTTSINEAYLGGRYIDMHGTRVLALGVDEPTRDVKCHTCWRVITTSRVVKPRVDTSPVLEELWEKERAYLETVGTQTTIDEPEPKALTGVVQPREIETGELFAITMDGAIQPLSDVAVVRLSQDQYDLLVEYSTPELRWQYGEDHTLHLNGDFIQP